MSLITTSQSDSCNFAQMPGLDLVLTVDECSNLETGGIPLSIKPTCIYNDSNSSSEGYAVTDYYLGMKI